MPKVKCTTFYLEDMLLESQKYQDLGITCCNGRFQCNSFLFMTIFPGVTQFLDFQNRKDDNMSLIIPDVDVNDFHSLFNNIYNKNSNYQQSSSLVFLLTWKQTATSQKEETVKNIKEIDIKY